MPIQNKVKILHILHAVGGVDVYLRLLLNHIDTSKFTTIIIKGTNDSKEVYFDKNNELVKTYSSSIQREIEPISDLKSILEVRKIIKKEKPDLIHAHSAKGGIIARSAALFTGIPVAYTPHAFSYLSAENKKKEWLFKNIEKLFRFTGNYVLATSPSEANRAMKEVGYKKEKVIVYNNSVAPIRSIDKNHSFQLPDKYICSIGRPSYQKNIEAMVEVFSKVKKEIPELNMVLMGVGYHSPNEAQVKSLIKKYGLEDSFILLPWVSREELFPIIKNAVLYISTSRYEGLPYSIIESMALSKACVVSDCDGNRDLIKNDVNGKVYSQETLVEVMHEGIIELCKNESKRKEFEAKSFELFNQKYNIENTISQLEEIYNTLISR